MNLPDVEDFIGTFVTSAAKIFAPNSLNFDDAEFERAHEDDKRAAIAAMKLVQPGDLIFITTRGLVYSLARYLTNHEYDHVAIVLNDTEVLHVGPPSVRAIALQRLLLPQRQPVVLRVSMTDSEREKFVRCVHTLVGAKYDVTRVYQLLVRLSLAHMTNSRPLGRLPFDVHQRSWICSDAALVMLTGCSASFREALKKTKQKTALDIFLHGSASFSDFTRIRQYEPEVLVRVPLPVSNYTLKPRRRPFKAYYREFVELVSRIHSGNMRWHLLEHSILPRARNVVNQIGHADWSFETKSQVFVYVIILLVALKRGTIASKVFVRTLQVLMLRYVVQQVMLHMNLRNFRHAISRL